MKNLMKKLFLGKRQVFNSARNREHQNSPDCFICPVCLTKYDKKDVPPEMPLCPSCDSEGFGVEVLPITMLLDKLTAEDLKTWLNNWRMEKGFGESYQKLKEQRILELISLKEQSQQGGGGERR